jgi:hypothetical protein
MKISILENKINKLQSKLDSINDLKKEIKLINKIWKLQIIKQFKLR